MLSVVPYEPSWNEAAARVWSESYAASSVAVPGVGDALALARRIPVEIAGGWSVWLALWADAPVGFLALAPAEHQLCQLFVAPAAQGRGVGSVLLRHAMADLGEGLWLSVMADNAAARRFYERHGLCESEHGIHPGTGQKTVIYRRTPAAS